MSIGPIKEDTITTMNFNEVHLQVFYDILFIQQNMIHDKVGQGTDIQTSIIGWKK